MKQNFKKMTDEELVALMETADEKTVAEIEKELDARDAVRAAGNTEEAVNSAESEENVDDKKAELDALFVELQQKVGHRCKLVPAGTIEWAEGTIVGCVKVKRSNTVAFAVKLDNGKRVVKNHKAPLFEILEEVVERTAVRRSNGNRTKAGRWSEERMAEEVAKYIGNVGREIIVTNEQGEEITGQITGIVPIKRSNSVLYRVVLPVPTEEDPKAAVTVHKSVANTSSFTICEATEASDAYYADYMSHREALANRQPLTGAELVLDLELKLEKAEDAVKKAQEKVEAIKKALEEKRAEEAKANNEANNEGDGDML